MSPKPFRFLDLPKEIRDIIYRHVLICEDSTVCINKNGVARPSEVKQAIMFFRISKFVAAEAKQIFYAENLFWNSRLPDATRFIETIGQHNASQIKMLQIDVMTYEDEDARQIACCTTSALKITAKNLGEVCTGLEVLYLTPEQYWERNRVTVNRTCFDFWTQDAFVAIQALATAFPWLKDIRYHDSFEEQVVRMTSLEKERDEGMVCFHSLWYFQVKC